MPERLLTPVKILKLRRAYIILIIAI